MAGAERRLGAQGGFWQSEITNRGLPTYRRLKLMFHEVHKGIDSLYLSFWGDLKPGLKEDFEKKKLLAQSDDPKDQAEATHVIGDHAFELLDRGRGKYLFVLSDNWFHIQISGSEKKMLPTVYVQISSELLNCLGLENSVNELRSVVGEILVAIEKERVSRADIFVDAVIDTDFEKISRNQFVCRANKITCHWSGIPFSGWSIGLGGVVSARIYDKTVEIEQKSKKDYFKTIWQNRGWQEGQKVWRLEFQLRREFLEQMTINSVTDLMDTINDIWRYCTVDWLRITIDDGTENRTRLEIVPFWENIQLVSFGAGDCTGIVRVVKKARIPSDETLFLNGYGFFTAYAAREGHENTFSAMLNYVNDAKQFHDEYVKNSNLYQDGEDYRKTKLNIKKRKFNILRK